MATANDRRTVLVDCPQLGASHRVAWYPGTPHELIEAEILRNFGLAQLRAARAFRFEAADDSGASVVISNSMPSGLQLRLILNQPPTPSTASTQSGAAAPGGTSASTHPGAHGKLTRWHSQPNLLGSEEKRTSSARATLSPLLLRESSSGSERGGGVQLSERAGAGGSTPLAFAGTARLTSANSLGRVRRQKNRFRALLELTADAHLITEVGGKHSRGGGPRSPYCSRRRARR
jgi:hypothetical protein